MITLAFLAGLGTGITVGILLEPRVARWLRGDPEVADRPHVVVSQGDRDVDITADEAIALGLRLPWPPYRGPGRAP